MLGRGTTSSSQISEYTPVESVHYDAMVNRNQTEPQAQRSVLSAQLQTNCAGRVATRGRPHHVMATGLARMRGAGCLRPLRLHSSLTIVQYPELVDAVDALTMPVLSASLDAFLVVAIAIIIPTAYALRRQPQLLTQRNVLSVVVVLHSLYILYAFIIRAPPNIFTRLKIPLTAPTEAIRATLLHRANLPRDAALPRPLEALFTRLSSFEMRTLYVRSAHSTNAMLG